MAARRILIKGLAEHCTKQSLGEAATFLNGTSYDVAQVNEFGTAPIIRISNITDPSSTYLRTEEHLDRKFWVSLGDLLVSWSASFKSIVWPGPEGYLNQHIFKVTERQGFDRRYIRHAIEASFDEMQENVVGIGMMHLRRADFLGHPIPAPPLNTQKAVADYLDFIEAGGNGKRPALPHTLEKEQRVVAQIEELHAQIHEARTLRRQATEEAKTLASNVVRSLFPEPSRSIVRDRIKFQTGYAFKSEWFSDSGIRLARNANVGHGTLDWSETVRMPEAKRAEFPRFELQAGDILITLDRPIISTGVKVARVRDQDLPCLLLQRVARAQFQGDSVLPEYFFRWLQSPHFINAIVPGRSNGVPHISHKDIEKIPFAVPPLPDQNRIVAELDALQAEVDALKHLQAETAAELDALLPAILDKAFKGEL
jgi:restriction endonuclease S subunit